MAISTALSTVLSSIAAISISGVTVKDVDELPEEILIRDAGLLFPRVDPFMDGFNYERMSQGGGSVALGDMTYTLHYRYCHAPVGSERTVAEIYSGLVTNLVAIVNAILTNDAVTGCVNLELSGLSVGLVEDPSGQQWHGADIDMGVLEFQN